MKKYTLLLFLLSISYLSFSQSQTTQESLLKKDNLNLSNATEVNIMNDSLTTSPVYPGCESILGNMTKKKCMNKSITKFFLKNINSKLIHDYSFKKEQKIFAAFKIDKEGNIQEIKARTKYKKLEKESIRIIKMLPRMTPAMQNGKPKEVVYGLPITVSSLGIINN